MELIHRIIGIVGMVCLIALPVLAVAALLYLRRHKGDPAAEKRAALPLVLCLVLCIACYVTYFIMSVKKYSSSEDAMETVPTITITSENLHDGVWDAVISNTDTGENQSPQLSWEPVEGAAAYGILMLDPDGGNWLHWKTGTVTRTTLPTGYADSSTYVGPYPPEGQVHTYVIYVAALREADPYVRGTLDFSNEDATVKALLSSMDVLEDGSTGNVLAVGSLSGTYPAP